MLGPNTWRYSDNWFESSDWTLFDFLGMMSIVGPAVTLAEGDKGHRLPTGYVQGIAAGIDAASTTAVSPAQVESFCLNIGTHA